MPELLVDRQDGVVVLTLHRPEARNALDAALRGSLMTELERCDADPDAAVVIITGTDPAFSAGVDLKEGLSDGAPAGSPAGSAARNPGHTLRAMATPVIAAVNGACVTGALEIALSCSFILASDRARFADTHARVGLLPAWGMSALLPRAVGVRMARQMTATGNFVDATTALRAGLVNEVVPHEQLMTRARELAADVASAEPDAVRESLALYDRGDGATTEEALQLEAEAATGFSLDRDNARERFAATIKRGSASG